jgi:hypothetical protein
MPSAGVILLCAAIGGVFYVGDAVVHSKSIHKLNHAVCRVVTLDQKCKPKPKAYIRIVGEGHSMEDAR